MRKLVVTEGNSDQVVNRFSQPGIIEQQEGFVDLQVLVKKVSRGDEEIIVMIRWESEQHWKNWEKSNAHIAGHKANRGKSQPDFMVSTEVGMYEVKTVKTAPNAE